MTSIQKQLQQLLVKLLYILLGVATLLLLADKGWWRYVGIAAFLFALFQFVSLMRKLPSFITDLFPNKVVNSAKTTRSTNIIYKIGTTLVALGMISILFEMNSIDRTIHGMRLCWISVGIGIALFIVTIMFLKMTFSSTFDEGRRSANIFVCFLVGFLLLTPSIASFINTKFASEIIERKEFGVVSKGKSSGRNPANFIFCKIDGKTERFQVSPTFWDVVEVNKTVVLCTRKGFFGYDYVENYRLPYME